MNARQPTRPEQIKDLIDTCKNHPSPVVREMAARSLYLTGAADGLDRRANQNFDQAIAS